MEMDVINDIAAHYQPVGDTANDEPLSMLFCQIRQPTSIRSQCDHGLLQQPISLLRPTSSSSKFDYPLKTSYYAKQHRQKKKSSESTGESTKEIQITNGAPAVSQGKKCPISS